MRAIRKMVFGAAMILAASLSGAIEDDSYSPQQAADLKDAAGGTVGICMLSGKVVNFDTGEPVPYFHLLHMEKSGGVIEHLETDGQGNFHTTAPKGSERHFQFDRSRRGMYIIDWDLQRQVGFRPFRGVVRDDMTDLVFKVRLWPVRVLTGKVLGQSGQAVNNASLYIHCDVPAVKTSPTGVFKIMVAPTDRDFDLFAISEDMNQAGLIHLKAGATAATIHLEPTASYKGRVIDTAGRAVGPFKLLLGLRPSGSDSDCLQQQIYADTDGTFTIDDLCPKADYFAWWFPDEQINHTIGENGGKVIALAEYESERPIEITVEQYLNTLSGRVLSVKGEPVSGAKIMVLTTHGIQASYRQNRAVFTGEKGEFSLANLADGEVLFNVYAKGYKSRKIWAPTDAANLEIILKSPSETSVYEVSLVDDKNRPIPNAPVNLYFSVAEAGREVITSHTATTNEAGQARFNVKPFGDNVQHRGILSCDIDGCDLAYNSVWHQDDSQVKLVLHEPGEYWSGKIVDPQQNPISGARLYMTSMSQRTRTSQRTAIQWLSQSHFSAESELGMLARTNAKGEFVLNRFNKKDFVRVVVKAPGFKRQEIDFSPERDAGSVFQLSVGVAVVKGLLISESSGKPVPRASIQLRAYNLPGRDIVTNESGSFIIEDLESGEYVPVFQSLKGGSDGNYVCVPESFVAESGKTMQVTLKARNGVLLKGRLIESDTQQRPSAKRVYLEARLKSGQTISSDSIDKNGSWELLLPPGDYDLYYSIFLDDISRFVYSEEPLSVTVENKEHENLVLEISDRGSLSLQPPLLVGRALSDFKDLNISPLPADTDNKVILICFFDMNQRPSRNCIIELAKQAEQLKEKGVTVVAVQASKVGDNALHGWVKANNIPFPVGMIRGDEKKTRFNWGVKSLPWLILTDSKHIVRAAGFGLDNLDTMIEEMNNVAL